MKTRPSPLTPELADRMRNQDPMADAEDHGAESVRPPAGRQRAAARRTTAWPNAPLIDGRSRGLPSEDQLSITSRLDDGQFDDGPFDDK